MDWSTHFPTFFQPPPAEGEGSVNLKGKKVEFADVGCGFGGLSIALAPLFPETLMLGECAMASCKICIRSDRFRVRRSRDPRAGHAVRLGQDPRAPPEPRFGRPGQRRRRCSSGGKSGRSGYHRREWRTFRKAPKGVEQGEAGRAEAAGPRRGRGRQGPRRQAGADAAQRLRLRQRQRPPSERDEVPAQLFRKGTGPSLLRCRVRDRLRFDRTPLQQLSKLFFLFPDPHFKARKHKARIIS